MPRISNLTSLSTPSDSDEIAIVDTSASVTKKITRGDLLSGAPLPADTVDTQAIENDAVTTAKLADDGVTSDKLAEAFFKGRKQQNTTNSDVEGLKVMHGWGFIEGNGTAAIEKTVTFPTTFTSAPVVIVCALGADTSGVPVAIGEFTTEIGTTIGIQASDIEADDFKVSLDRATGTYSSGNYHGFSWIAIGI